MAIYLTSDTHFNHDKILEYCHRPFNNVYEMNEHIIHKWNEIVQENDLVMHLGDFGFGDLETILNRLNGRKILIMGNHDKYGVHMLRQAGFEDVYKKPLTIGDFILSHKPILNISYGLINFHGHIHNADTSLIAGYNKNIHINVSVDITDFSPIRIEDLEEYF